MGSTKKRVTPTVWAAADKLAEVARTILTQGSDGMLPWLKIRLDDYDEAMAAHKASLAQSQSRWTAAVKRQLDEQP